MKQEQISSQMEFLVQLCIHPLQIMYFYLQTRAQRDINEWAVSKGGGEPGFWPHYLGPDSDNKITPLICNFISTFMEKA